MTASIRRFILALVAAHIGPTTRDPEVAATITGSGGVVKLD